jgi:modulator of FtsH protease
MTETDLQAWNEFALAQAGAAAVLTGLVFVAVSMNVSAILSHRELPGRAGEGVIIFVSVLCQSAVLLVPHQSERAIGAELLLLAGGTLAILLGIFLPTLGRPSLQPTTWRVTRLLLILTTTIPTAVAGAGLLGWVGADLRWYAFGTLWALVAAMTNAWVLLVEVIRDKRYVPVTRDA